MSGTGVCIYHYILPTYSSITSAHLCHPRAESSRWNTLKKLLRIPGTDITIFNDETAICCPSLKLG